MKIKHVMLAVLLSTFATSPAFAELRHVELKTLGMD